MIDNEQIARMLRHYEGPPEPRVDRRAHRFRAGWRSYTAVAGGFAIAVVVVAIMALHPFAANRSRTSNLGAGGGGTSCGARLQYHGSPYVGDRIDFSLPLGATLGSGTDLCLGRSIDVVAIVGIDPKLAVVDAGEPAGIVYVAAGRCVGFAQSEFEACLRQPLDFSGTRYVGTRLLQPVELGQPLGPGSLADRGVRVVRANGIPSSRAVALENANDARRSELVYLAPGVCPLAGLEQLEQCLEAP